MSGSNSSARASLPDSAEAETPLSFAVHAMPHPGVDDGARRTATGRLKMLLVLLVCAAPVVASSVAYFVIRPDGRSNYATLIEPPRPAPAALGLGGNWTLVVVAGGACDARCEKNLWLVRQLRESVGREKDRISKLWLVDDATAPRAALLDSIAVGTPTRVLPVPRDTLAAWLQPEPGRAVADHLYLVDPMGLWMMRTPVEVDAGRFKRDLERLLRASASWQKPRPQPGP